MLERIHFRKLSCLVLIFMLMASSAFAVQGRWKVSVMQPKDAVASGLYAIDNGQSAGYVMLDTPSGKKYVAAVWKSDTSEWVKLSDFSSTAYDISGGQQVGFATNFAWLWDGGLTDGKVLLPPENGLFLNGYFKATVALGLSNGWQVGQAVEASSESDDYSRAVLWHGADTKPTILHYGEAQSNSSINGMYDASADSPGIQLGYQEIFDGEAYWNPHATLWKGTAESHIDLNPSGAKGSEVFRGYGNQQVGYAEFKGSDQAILWNGSAANYVNLHPSLADKSYAKAIYDGYQVGYIYRTGDPELYSRAWLWEGSANRYVDLHELLPPEYIFSFAQGIEVSGGHIYVVGSAYNYQSAREEAIIWHFTPFGPMIWANGKSGSIDVDAKQGFSLSAAFSAGTSESTSVDLWLILYNNKTETYYYLDEKGKWQPGYDDIRICRPFYTGPLFSFSPIVIYKDIVFPPNSYTFSFAVSWPSTGILEGGVLFDQVDVNVK